MYDDIIERGLHLKDGCSYDGDHPCTCYVKAHLDMVIAARVPGGAAGEALEALAQIEREAGAYEHWAMPNTGRLKSALDGIALLAERTLAAARAPGPAGGELEVMRIAGLRPTVYVCAPGAVKPWACGWSWTDSKGRHQSRHELGETPDEAIRAAAAAAAPVEPGGG